MSDAVITVILTQVATIMEQQIRQEVRLVSGVEKEVKKLKSAFESIKAVLVDAEKRQVKEESVKVWLEKLKDVSEDTEDVLSQWITANLKAEIEGPGSHSSPTKKVCSLVTLPCLGCNRVALRRDIALKIKYINERLDVIATEKDRYKFNVVTGSPDRPKTTSFIVVSDVQGRDIDKNTLVSELLSSSHQEQGLNIVSIVGMGGIGKTTLAQAVYNYSAVIEHFERRMWVCVSEPFDEVRIAKAILEDVEGSAPYLFELETITRKIRNHVQGKKFLLVLDDVWTDDFRKWEQLLNSLSTGAAGSAILVTTRNERVAKVMGSRYNLPLGQLSGDDSWSLFKRIAFFERKPEECEELEGVGRKISDKCKGLPLTVKTISSLMRFKNSLKDWHDVLSSEFWELEEAEGLFPPLMLSYYDLPSTMKPCFSFCAIFPKDHVIEVNNLIKLWMAQGYLSSTEMVEMEAIGQEYLQNLAMRSFFQDLQKDKDDKRILSVKMHDMVHDFAQYLTKNECCVIEVNNNLERKMESSHKRARHVTLIRSEDARFPDVPNVEKFFTFWVQSFHDSPPIVSQLDRVEPELLRRLARVRALDLSRNRIGELPKEIGNLIRLKYLNLSHNPFWELPANLCDLFNLQTLKLSACDHLRKLPRHIGRLINLRHLEIDRTDSLKTLPKGIGNLKSLHTLSKFIIVRGNDRGEATCGLEDLNNLNNLRGSLRIEGLGYVANADEAKTAELQNKNHLSELQMDFSPAVQTGSQDEVIEALRLNENLQSLQISSYRGTTFPTWFMTLTSLQKLFLQDCQNCTYLPPLGRLPSLLTLHLEGMNTVKFLGLEFLGLDGNDNDTMNGEGGPASSSEAKTAFPKLKKLKISKMQSWEVWNVINNDGEISDENFKIMPRLRCLKVSDCTKLKALPPLLLQTSPLGKLRIHNCPLLQQLYKRKTGEEWNKISHISKVRIS
ncbi:UNVERIFIED_CONTAM: putative disease resistance protein RGA3 [Sesamum angustifolium]|uniref:Disease resistance protein RGA3 n=1 Tax=Sesamum angustifolium TaxID=2727405 RepID=A0AAW2LL58_9LAMI